MADATYSTLHLGIVPSARTPASQREPAAAGGCWGFGVWDWGKETNRRRTKGPKFVCCTIHTHTKGMRSCGAAPGAVDWNSPHGFSLSSVYAPRELLLYTLEYVHTASPFGPPHLPSPPARGGTIVGPIPTNACAYPKVPPGIMTLLHACLSHFSFSSCSLHAYMQQDAPALHAGGRWGRAKKRFILAGLPPPTHPHPPSSSMRW